MRAKYEIKKCPLCKGKGKIRVKDTRLICVDCEKVIRGMIWTYKNGQIRCERCGMRKRDQSKQR